MKKMSRAEPDLLLHQVLQVRDPLRVFRVAADVVLVEEGLWWQEGEEPNAHDTVSHARHIQRLSCARNAARTS